MFVESPTLYASTFSFAGEEKVVKVVTAPLGIFGVVKLCAARAATSVFIRVREREHQCMRLAKSSILGVNNNERTKRDEHYTDDDEFSDDMDTRFAHSLSGKIKRGSGRENEI